MIKIFSVLALVLVLGTPVFSQDQVQQDLQQWGIQSEQTNNQLVIEDSESTDLFDMTYNLSFAMNALESVLQDYNGILSVEYVFRNSNVMISSEWFEYYLSLESDKDKRKAIEQIVDSIKQEQ